MRNSLDIAQYHEMTDVTDVHKTTIGEEDVETVELLSATSTTLSTLKSPKPPHGLLRKQLGIGLATATAILLLNLSLLMWSLSRTRSIHGTAPIFTGDCRKSRRILVTITLLINIFSTILLGVCNNAAQYVSSPTRGEIHAAHRKGRWLHIGTHSFNNLRGIAKKRTIVWALLVSSSLPLHLFWNAIVHEKLSANSYFAAIVTPDFLNPESSYYYNQTNTASTSPVVPRPESIAAYHQNSSSLQFLDKNTCLDAYNSAYQSNHRNVLLVVNTIYAQPLVTVTGFVPDAGHSTPVWPCDGNDLLGRSGIPATEICDTDFLRKNTSWHINMLLCESNSSNGHACTKSQVLDLEVNYCLAESSEGHCSIELVPQVLLIVVICNSIKVVCLAVILLLPRFQPVAIIGDAISSFLEMPDPITQSVGPISAKQARHREPAGLAIGTVPGRGTPWRTPKRHKRWCQAASPWRWILLTIVLIIMLILLLLESMFVPKYATFFQLGGNLGLTKHTTSLAVAHGSALVNALVTNILQLVTSTIYLVYNNVLSCMLFAHETNRFAKSHGRKPLRTSFPLAGQRAAHFLQIPFRYALLLSASVALLHFFVSEAIFLTTVDVYDVAGNLDTDASFTVFMQSQGGLNASMIWASVLLVILYILGLLPLQTKNMPLVSNNSLAISAACHALDTDRDAAKRPIVYGVLVSPRERMDRAGFSSMEVGCLQDGVVYH